MDAFALIMLAIAGGMLAALVLLGLLHPRSGAQTLDWKPTRSPELEMQNEIDDLDQMLEAVNARRRAKGQPEITADALSADLARERRA